MKTFTEILNEHLPEKPAAVTDSFPASVPLYEVPLNLFAKTAAVLQNERKALLAAEWAADETRFEKGFAVYACFRRNMEYVIIKSSMTVDNPSFPTLTGTYVPAYRFERQIQSLMGITPEGHPDLRPWIKFEDWPNDMYPLRKSFNPSIPVVRIQGEYPFAESDGEGICEIAVGPVHAGIIEPGHFRFTVMGEDILNLEARLGYTHKGIEKRFESLDWISAARLASRVSGDSAAAHSLAYCRAVEAMTQTDVPDRAHWLRALFVERERIANHIADIGAIANDAAFAFMLYQCMRLKEIMLRTNLRLFGHRIFMDVIVPGGVSANVDSVSIASLLEETDTIEKEFARLTDIVDKNSSLIDRLRTTGIVSSEFARELGITGLAARASSMHLDCRVRQPFTPYNQLGVQIKVLSQGDVHARVWVRIEEVKESFRLVREILKNLPEGNIHKEIEKPVPEASGFSAVEGWRGEIIYWVQSDPDGGINRCMVRDPSSLNWIALEKCIHGNIVPDFPLCNKSFNLSYSGNDL